MTLLGRYCGCCARGEPADKGESAPLIPDEEAGQEDEDAATVVPRSFHQLAAHMATRSSTPLSEAFGLIAVSFFLVGMQTFALIAVAPRAQNPRTAWRHVGETMHDMGLGDVVMLAVVTIIVGLSVVHELKEIHFTSHWEEINRPPPGARRAAVRFALWLLCAARLFVVVPIVLALTILVPLGEDGVGAKGLALDALAILFILDLDEMVLEHGLRNAYSKRLPEAVTLPPSERRLYEHAHFVYLAGSTFAVLKPFILLILLTQLGRSDDWLAGVSSVTWLVMEQAASAVLLARTHVLFWRLFSAYRERDLWHASSWEHEAETWPLWAKALSVLPAWLVARGVLLFFPAELVLFANPDPLPLLRDPTYLLTFITTDQYLEGLAGVGWNTPTGLVLMGAFIVANVLLGALSAVPACFLRPDGERQKDHRHRA